jgi:hypothetical protein
MVQWAQRECPAFVLSLSNVWFPCTVRYHPNSMLMISDAAENIAGGMSGSPIIVLDGVVATAGDLVRMQFALAQAAHH